MDTIHLQTIKDARGSLTVAEKLPFDIKRVYYLHGCSQARGGHAQRSTDRLITAVSGFFTVQIRSVKHWQEITLDDPTIALRVPPLTWIELHAFSEDAVCLVIASKEHEEEDSIRDFAQFLQEARRAA